ncbi:putative choline dehydrogenase [Pholiota molesta]|nr:putative choline dehydrogenase [Pholiota molesta]
MHLNLSSLTVRFFIVFSYLCYMNQVSARVNGTSPDSHTSAPAHTSTPEYDYIVVGSGPGGGPLAVRLAQAGYSVLLIDAGEDHGADIVVEVPVFQGAASEYTPISWEYFVHHYDNLTIAQQDSKFTYRMSDGRFWVGPNPPAGSVPLGILYPRTGTLGGCAEHNAMLLIYPAESDWDNIATLTGDDSWCSENMRKYFVRFEKNEYLSPETSASAGHGFNGWLTTTVADPRNLYNDPTLLGMLHGAAIALGKVTSFFTTKLTIPSNLAQVVELDLNNDSKTRDTSTANNKAFKLKLQLNTLVTRVIFDHSSSTPHAVGVEYQTGSHLYRADPNAASGIVTGAGSFFAKREVIISGGVFNTPPILKLSGIGPSAELKEHNIPVVHESPGVGTNMQDRYEVSVVSSTSVNLTNFNGCTFLNTTDDPCFFQWLNNATNRGIYGINGFAFSLTHSSSVADRSAADLIMAGIPAFFAGYFPGWSNRLAADAHHWSWFILKAHTRNTAGTVTLTSSDPLDVPQINFRNFAIGGDEDLQAAFEAVQLARRMLAASEPLTGPITEEIPGPAVQTEAEIKQWIRNEAWGHHASCTVAIGRKDDTNSVLDSKFRVKGVSGLRVVDASVFPKIPSLTLEIAYFREDIFYLYETSSAITATRLHEVFVLEMHIYGITKLMRLTLARFVDDSWALTKGAKQNSAPSSMPLRHLRDRTYEYGICALKSKTREWQTQRPPNARGNNFGRVLRA